MIGGLILTLIFAGQAHDASEANGVGFPFGEFRLNEGRYSCLSTTQTQSNTFYYWLDACLYIGDLRIGHDRETLERVLGTDSFEAGSPDARYFVYTLYENEDGEPETVVNIWYNVKGLAKVIQLSGRPNVDWSFSSIQLGNAEADVIERLGEHSCCIYRWHELELCWPVILVRICGRDRLFNPYIITTRRSVTAHPTSKRAQRV